MTSNGQLSEEETTLVLASAEAVGCAQSAVLLQQYLTLEAIQEGDLDTARHYARELRDRADGLCRTLGVDTDQEGGA